MSAPLSSQPLVILGMFRSGTSCVATCFSKLGFYFGEKSELFPPDEFNPGGYHELKDLMNLNRKILGVFGMRHFQVEEIPEGWEEIPGTLELVSDLEGLLKAHLGGRERWGWKEPQTSVILPLYRHLFTAQGIEPRYIICVRHPLAVNASQRTHSPLPPIGERVMGLWLHYTLSALHESRGARRMVIHYESFLQDPKPFLSHAFAMMDNLPATSDNFSEAAACVRREWQHFKHNEDELGQWPPLVASTYELAKRCAAAPSEFQSGLFDRDIESLWLQWRQMREMVKSSAMPTGRIITHWQERGKPLSAEIGIQPEGKWQTAIVPITAPPGTAVHIDPYQTPSIVWIRKAVVRNAESEAPADLRPGRSGMLSPVNGLKRLVIWGPDPMILNLPAVKTSELELEILIQSNPHVLADVIGVLRANIEFVVQKLNQTKN